MDYREVGVNTLMGGSSSLFGRGSSSSTQFYSFIQKKKKGGLIYSNYPALTWRFIAGLRPSSLPIYIYIYIKTMHASWVKDPQYC